jgi:hypothetical protein
MTSVEQLRADVLGICDQLPHAAGSEFADRMESVAAQVGAVMRGSADEAKVTGILQNARAEGTNAIQTSLAQLNGLLVEVANNPTW